MRALAVFVGLFFAAVAGCGAAPAEKPQDPYSWDFGRVSGGAPVSHEFALVNNGTAVMNITGKTNSCECMESQVSGEAVTPGESVTVKATFNPAGYAGPVEQFVYVTTDDPENPVYRFSIKADVAG